MENKIALAKKWDPRVNPSGYLMSEKMDGMRSYWEDGHFVSRTGHEINVPEHIINKMPKGKGIVMDGEFFIDYGKFEECISICRRKDYSGDWSKIKYLVFDAPTSDGNVIERLETIKCFENEFIQIIGQKECGGYDDLNIFLHNIEKKGGEGVMLRDKNALFKPKRTSDILKVKTFHDDEAEVIGYVEGKGKHKGRVGSLICKNIKNGKIFNVGSGLTDKLRNEESFPIGTVITYNYFELTKNGMPRFPTYMRIRNEE